MHYTSSSCTVSHSDPDGWSTTHTSNTGNELGDTIFQLPGSLLWDELFALFTMYWTPTLSACLNDPWFENYQWRNRQEVHLCNYNPMMVETVIMFTIHLDLAIVMLCVSVIQQKRLYLYCILFVAKTEPGWHRVKYTDGRKLWNVMNIAQIWENGVK